MILKVSGNRLNDKHWEALFHSLPILEEVDQKGFFIITSAQINTERESRLMAKFDQESALPDIFRRYHLSLLPISRSKYMIGHFDTHLRLPERDTSVHTTIALPESIQSIDHSNLHSEGLALMCAYNAGIIDELADEETRLTLLGRMSTGIFDFRIANNSQSSAPYAIHVENAQCEIDAGFEGKTALILVEAKNISVESFIIRQLYYPYRLWRERMPYKRIVPMLMVFSDDVFTFYTFSFTDPEVYSSIHLESTKCYKIAAGAITQDDISRLFSLLRPVSEPSITFPQADVFENVLDLLGLLDERDLTREEIVEKFSFVGRQASYYTDAARYLGLVDKYAEKRTVYFSLNNLSSNLLRRRHRERYLEIIRLILERPIFYEVFQKMTQLGAIPEVESRK